MRITRIEAKNFLTFGDPGITLEELTDPTVIVGPNAAGKTNLFRALEFVGDVFTRQVVDSGFVQHRYDPNLMVDLCLEVKYSDDEARALADLLLASAKTEVRFGGRNDIDTNAAALLARRLIDYLRPAFIALFTAPVRYRVRGQAQRAQPLDYLIELTSDRPLFIGFNGLSTTDRRVNSFRSLNIGEVAVEELVALYPGAIGMGPARRVVTDQEMMAFGAELDLHWLLEKFREIEGLPVNLNNFGTDLENYGNQPGESEGDVAHLRNYLRQRAFALRGLGARELGGLIFQTSLARLSGTRALPSTAPVPALATIPTVASSIDGSEIANLLYRLKISSDPRDRSRFYGMINAFENFTGFGVDVVVESRAGGAPVTPPQGGVVPLGVQGSDVVALPAQPEAAVQVATLRWNNGVVDFPIEYAAAGLFELLLAFYLLLGRTDSVILLDEPASNLHPNKQRVLLELIAAAAFEFKNQVLLVSHSPFLVDPRRAKSVVRFSFDNGRTVGHRFQPESAYTPERLIRILERNPQLIGALFAGRVVLCEGGGEAGALPIWFSKLPDGGRLEALNVEFIDVGGKGNFEGYAKALEVWGIPWRAVADRDSTSEVAAYGDRAHCFPFNDFSEVLEAECDSALQVALNAVRSRNGSHSPAVAREVAFATDPPSTVLQIWEFLREFLTAE